MSNKFTDWYRQLLRNSKYRWLIVGGTLLYLISPIDLLPDMIPIVGQIDDVLIATLLVTEVTQMLLERVKSVKSKSDQVAVEQTTAADSVDVNAIHVE